MMKNSSHRDKYPAMQSNGPLPQVSLGSCCCCWPILLLLGNCWQLISLGSCSCCWPILLLLGNCLQPISLGSCYCYQLEYATFGWWVLPPVPQLVLSQSQPMFLNKPIRVNQLIINNSGVRALIVLVP